ncbi:hypothetical protein [Embleya hyalina]|uniref:Uncharacterized protein n=1 Tax=Embleya hyalina TaxID=516124 RepID=A0A401YUV9_9ACTN|nr:hypothetical protein [Embleya hyalina]GCD98359.1 hypothetical protein EHYA_06066 [Embleya hyalina]
MRSKRWILAGLGVGVVGGFVGGLLGGSRRPRVPGPPPWAPAGPAIPVHALPRGSRWPVDRDTPAERSARARPGG